MVSTQDVWGCRFKTPSCLDLLNGANLIFSVGVPNCVCILKEQSNTGFEHSFLCLLVADLEVVPEEATCPDGLVGDGVDISTQFHVILDVNTKVFCGADVLKGVSMQL